MRSLWATLACLPVVAANPWLHSPVAFVLPQSPVTKHPGAANNINLGRSPCVARQPTSSDRGNLASSSRRVTRNNGRSRVRMNFGEDGILGVGAPEIAVICVVGYFLLGPTEVFATRPKHYIYSRHVCVDKCLDYSSLRWSRSNPLCFNASVTFLYLLLWSFSALPPSEGSWEIGNSITSHRNGGIILSF
jgi:hypothetical protein